MKKDKTAWQIYNYALILNTPPHYISVGEEEVARLSEWQLLVFFLKRRAFFAMYTTDFDIQLKMPFWYVIKDGGYDFNELKSESRRQIRRGRESFLVKKICPQEYLMEMYEIFCSAMQGYDESERISVSYEEFCTWYADSSDTFLGAFVRNGDGTFGEMVGYKIYSESDDGYVKQSVQKVKVEWERMHVAHVLEDVLLSDVFDKTDDHGKYVCCGWRNLNHKTRNEDFLEEHFKFRKAYCVLHIRGCILFWLAVFVLMPFYPLFVKSSKKSFYAVGSVLRMVKVAHECRKIIRKCKHTEENL